MAAPRHEEREALFPESFVSLDICVVIDATCTMEPYVA